MEPVRARSEDEGRVKAQRQEDLLEQLLRQQVESGDGPTHVSTDWHRPELPGGPRGPARDTCNTMLGSTEEEKADPAASLLPRLAITRSAIRTSQFLLRDKPSRLKLTFVLPAHPDTRGAVSIPN